MSVLYIGCTVPMWGVRYVCPIYRMHGAYVGSSGKCPIYRMHGAYMGSSGTSVLYIGCMVPMWGVAVRLSYI